MCFRKLFGNFQVSLEPGPNVLFQKLSDPR